MKAEKPVAIIDKASQDSNKQNSTSTIQSVEFSKSPVTSQAVTTTDKLAAEKPVAVVDEAGQDSNKQNSTSTSIDKDKKVTDNSQTVAVETPKQLRILLLNPRLSPKIRLHPANLLFI